MAKIDVRREHRLFECHYSSEFSGRMCAVSIYEVVRPTWKIFKSTYRKYITFWVDDYETVKKGIVAMVEGYLDDENENEKIKEKWGNL